MAAKPFERRKGVKLKVYEGLEEGLVESIEEMAAELVEDLALAAMVRRETRPGGPSS